jgi:uncharacterized protein (DUF736 family)
MKHSALIIGAFTATDTGFAGKLDTLAIKASVVFERNEDKRKDSQPDFIMLSHGKEIGVAWERSGERGRYVSVSFEEPSLAPGFYTLARSGADKSYQLLYRKPMSHKDRN